MYIRFLQIIEDVNAVIAPFENAEEENVKNEDDHEFWSLKIDPS